MQHAGRRVGFAFVLVGLVGVHDDSSMVEWPKHQVRKSPSSLHTPSLSSLKTRKAQQDYWGWVAALLLCFVDDGIVVEFSLSSCSLLFHMDGLGKAGLKNKRMTGARGSA